MKTLILILLFVLLNLLNAASCGNSKFMGYSNADNVAVWDDSKYIYYNDADTVVSINFHKGEYKIYTTYGGYNLVTRHMSPIIQYNYSWGKYEIRKNIITCKDEGTPRIFKFKIIDHGKTLKVIRGNGLFIKSDKLDNY
jgi:hypothetical protein